MNTPTQTNRVEFVHIFLFQLALHVVGPLTVDPPTQGTRGIVARLVIGRHIAVPRVLSIARVPFLDVLQKRHVHVIPRRCGQDGPL